MNEGLPAMVMTLLGFTMYKEENRLRCRAHTDQEGKSKKRMRQEIVYVRLMSKMKQTARGVE